MSPILPSPISAKELVYMQVRASGPCSYGCIKGFLEEQMLNPDRSTPNESQVKEALNKAINELTKEDKIELYDIDCAWVLTEKEALRLSNTKL